MDEEVIRRVAYYYFVDKLSQKEIGENLGLSQAQVSRYIRKAKQDKVVIITVKDSYITELEKELCKRFKLKKVRLVQRNKLPLENEATLFFSLGLEVTRYFESVLKDKQIIGVSGGRVLREFIESVSGRPLKLKLFPLTLWTSPESRESVNPSILLSILQHKFRPDAEILRYELPPVNRFQEFKKHLEDNIAETISALLDLDILITGCGDINDEANPFYRLSEISNIKIEDLVNKGAVGNIFSHVIDSQGNELESGYEDFIVKLLSFEKLKDLASSEKKHIILASGGKSRREVIKACLRGQLFNVLITDEDTALELLKT